MKYYRLKYRLSITHSASGNREDSHNHVLEVEVSAYHNDGEFIELNHTATSRATFAKGAIKAAIWLANKEPKRYSIDDCLGL